MHEITQDDFFYSSINFCKGNKILRNSLILRVFLFYSFVPTQVLHMPQV